MFQLPRRAMHAIGLALLLSGAAALQSCAWLSTQASEPPTDVAVKPAASPAQAAPAASQSAEIAAAFRKQVQPALQREQQRQPASAPAAAAPVTAARTAPPAASFTPPPAASFTPPAALPRAAAGQGYRIGVGDRVRIDVRGEPDLSMDFAVGQTGTVSYPFLGELAVAGQTVDQLQARIDQGLRGGYLVNPDVRVMITEYRKFYINGEVKIPGGYSFIAGLTVRQAAALAGGFTERASMNKITVYREATPTNAQSANLDTPVYPGDTVVVAQGLF